MAGTRRKLDAAFKAKIAMEASREDAAVAHRQLGQEKVPGVFSWPVAPECVDLRRG